MIGKILIRTAIATGAVAGAVHLVRKHNLVSRAAVAANTVVEKVSEGAEKFVAKGIGLTDELLTKFDQAQQAEPSTVRGSGQSKVSFGDVREDPWAAATRNGNES